MFKSGVGRFQITAALTALPGPGAYDVSTSPKPKPKSSPRLQRPKHTKKQDSTGYYDVVVPLVKKSFNVCLS